MTTDPKHLPPSFLTELSALLNSRSAENGSDTPDFILAEFLLASLRAFDQGVRDRTRWYSRPSPWIACKDRMPEPRTDVLAVWWGGDRCIAFFDDRPALGGWWYINRSGGLRLAQVAPNAWQPLPPPPAPEASS